ncbi:MAG TPA: HD domain-containing phosphohydrolase [Candidatus Dormibacteraeota bacterium]|nr:HD domain-containing phosphohydrolase [Candidatus Dormibacteraeota bacterium]
MSLKPGTRIGPYAVVERIGQGGMATVYRAYHDGLDRDVAIKVLPEFFAEDPEYRERFRHEARAVARLKHPNILEVFDFGNQDGVAYIVMELAEGGTLADLLGGPMRLEQVLGLLEPLAAALDYAHSRGILHRDIKPANIFLRDGGAPVLADFGLSKLAGSRLRLTASGALMGTPEYMSPEQVSGGMLGPASDRYSFAVLAYQMFTGRVPFESESFASVLVSQMTRPMPPARELTGPSSAHVESVLRRALAKNPEERYASALSFVLALKPAAWMDRPDPITYLTQQPPPRRSSRRLPVVLVVDDVEANRELIKACLAEVECEIRMAEDGAEALLSIERERPDLVLLDVQMPGMDGFEVCHRIKRLEGGSLLPVVMITSLNDTSDRVRALTSGADDYMSKPVDRIELVARVRSALKLKRVYDSLDSAERVIYALAAAVEAKDPFTEAHTLRVAQAARRVGEKMGLPDDQLDALYRGGIIHDIGKIGVPDNILLKPGELDREEELRMHLHPIIGENIVAPLQTGGELLPLIRHHHERFDGSGYPDRLSGDDIPLLARILSVCDAYDALTNDRPYRPRQSHDAALAILRQGAGRQWDPRVVRLVLEEGGRPLQEASSL